MTTHPGLGPDPEQDKDAQLTAMEGELQKLREENERLRVANEMSKTTGDAAPHELTHAVQSTAEGAMQAVWVPVGRAAEILVLVTGTDPAELARIWQYLQVPDDPPGRIGPYQRETMPNGLLGYIRDGRVILSSQMSHGQVARAARHLRASWRMRHPNHLMWGLASVASVLTAREMMRESISVPLMTAGALGLVAVGSIGIILTPSERPTPPLPRPESSTTSQPHPSRAGDTTPERKTPISSGSPSPGADQQAAADKERSAADQLTVPVSVSPIRQPISTAGGAAPKILTPSSHLSKPRSDDGEPQGSSVHGVSQGASPTELADTAASGDAARTPQQCRISIEDLEARLRLPPHCR